MKKAKRFNSPMQSGFPVKAGDVRKPVITVPVGGKYRGNVVQKTPPIYSPQEGMTEESRRKQ